ncbi:MAG: DNA repair protein RecO [Ileibacterium sp.]|nr:DNA repair protein RecO [Ileibacterium sp.]
MNSLNKEGEVSGLVLSVIEYKDRDGIVKLAKEDEIVSVFARGIQIPSSKNARLCQPYSKVTLEYDPKYSRDMLYLIKGTLDYSSAHVQDDLEIQTLCQIISQLIEYRGINPAIYRHLEKMWLKFDGSDRNGGFLQAAYLLAELCRKEGIEPYVKSCVECGRTDQIEALDFSAGGLVCKEHRPAQVKPWPKKRMQQLVALIRSKGAHEDYLEDNFNWDAPWILLMLDWISWHLDLQLPSIEFFRTVSHMK